MTTRIAVLASWQGSVRRQIERPVRASLAGAALTAAMGDTAAAIARLKDAIRCIEDVAAEEESKRMTGTEDGR